MSIPYSLGLIREKWHMARHAYTLPKQYARASISRFGSFRLQSAEGMQTPKHADYSVVSGDGQIKEGERDKQPQRLPMSSADKIKPAGKAFRAYQP